MMKIIKKYTEDFMSGDSRKWTTKHWMIYISLTVTISLLHSSIVDIARVILNI